MSSGRLVVVGAADGGLRPAAWTSVDGLDWQRAPDDTSIAEPGSIGEMRDVVALPDGGFAASGSLDGLRRCGHPRMGSGVAACRAR